MRHTVAVTGIGVVSSLGCGRTAFWEGLSSGASGLAPLTLFDTAGLRSRAAGVVTFDPASLLGSKGLRYLSRTAHWLQCATALALDDAGLAADEHRADWALVVGTTFGSLASICAFDHESLRNGPASVNPMAFPNTVVNAPAGQTAIRFALTGPNITISTGCASGLAALGYAAGLIRTGAADCVIAGGAEELCEAGYLGYDRAGVLAPGDGTEHSLPFGQGRSGFVLAEGAAIVVLESEARARRRHACVLGTIDGYGEAFGGDAATSAMAEALGDARIDGREVQLVCTGASGSPEGDADEARALHATFGPHLPALAGHALKAATGEALGASGALQTLAGLYALTEQCVPPTPHAGTPDPACAVDGFLLSAPRRRPLARALVTASTREGQHSALVVAAAEPQRQG